MLADADLGAGSIGIVMMDLDHFKAVNDEHGHAVGDDVLIVAAKHLEAAMRVGDYAFRCGGEEFVAVLVGTDLDGATRVAERLRATIEAGADRALYEAKRTGRNRVSGATL